MHALPKSISIVLCLVSVLVVPGNSQTLSLLGSPDFAIDGSSSLAPYSQGTTSFTIDGSFPFGDGVGGGFLDNTTGLPTSYDWSGVTEFALTMSLVSANPSNIGFTLALIDPGLNVVGIFEGETTDITSTLSSFTLIETSRSDLSQVYAMQFTFNVAGEVSDLTIAEISAVPEPSTCALLCAGAVLLGVQVWRRRTAALRR